jgi:hypothetical protein
MQGLRKSAFLAKSFLHSGMRASGGAWLEVGQKEGRLERNLNYSLCWQVQWPKSRSYLRACCCFLGVIFLAQAS